MRVIGESKTVDLSKKLAVEISVGELALLVAVLGQLGINDATKAIAETSSIKLAYKPDVQRLDDYILYSEIKSVLRAEGVAE